MGIMEKPVELEMVFILKETNDESNLDDLNALLGIGWYVKNVMPMGVGASGGSVPYCAGLAVVVLRKVNI